MRDDQEHEALKALMVAARPYIENAAPHEQLFNAEDHRNFHALHDAMQAAEATLVPRGTARVDDPGDGKGDAGLRRAATCYLTKRIIREFPVKSLPWLGGEDATVGTEQEFENDQVRRMQRTGRCPCCGAEQEHRS